MARCRNFQACGKQAGTEQSNSTCLALLSEHTRFYSLVPFKQRRVIKSGANGLLRRSRLGAAEGRDGGMVKLRSLR